MEAKRALPSGAVAPDEILRIEVNVDMTAIIRDSRPGEPAGKCGRAVRRPGNWDDCPVSGVFRWWGVVSVGSMFMNLDGSIGIEVANENFFGV